MGSSGKGNRERGGLESESRVRGERKEERGEEGGEEGMKRRGGGLLVLQRKYGGCRSSAAGEFFLGIPDRPGLVSCSLNRRHWR